MNRLSSWRRTLAALAALALCPAAAAAQAAAQAAVPPALLPAPRQLALQAGSLRLGGTVAISVGSDSPDDRFAAGLVVAELASIDRLRANVARGASGAIVLARSDSSAGKRLLAAAGLVLPPEAEAEGYALIVTPRQAAVVAASAAGVFYGAQTLRQLIHPAPDGGATLPALRILDWPALPWRGLQIDVSRGPIPTQAALERDIALLAEFKLNLLALYFENTFAYAALPLMHAPGGAIDAAEAAQLAAFARPYHLTIVPEQESFGHLHLALREERFQDLAELPYGNVLTPSNPASLDFIGKMFAELNQAFPGPFFHIGADETAELGQGRSAALQQSEGAGPLYLDYLRQIDQRLAPYRRRVLFWGDIAQAHPELLSGLPKDMIAVPWSYGVRASYAPLIEPFRQAGLETWVSPSVHNFSLIYPDYNIALPNIAGFVADGRRLGVTGLLNTTWMDDGESLFDFTWYGDLFGAACGWEDQPDTARFDAAYDWALYRADGHQFAEEVAELTQIHKLLLASPLRDNGTDSLMWQAPFTPAGQALYARMEQPARQVRLLAENVVADLAANRAAARRNPDLLDPVEFAARRFDFVGEKAIYARYIAALYDEAAAHPADRAKVSDALNRINGINGLLQDMRDGDAGLKEQYRALWLDSNTPFFLDDILLRYDTELLYWQHQAQRFNDLAATWRATGKLPPLVRAEDGQ